MMRRNTASPRSVASSRRLGILQWRMRASGEHGGGGHGFGHHGPGEHSSTAVAVAPQDPPPPRSRCRREPPGPVPGGLRLCAGQSGGFSKDGQPGVTLVNDAASGWSRHGRAGA